MLVKELIKHLEGYDPEAVIAYDIWQVEDVLQQANDEGLVITKEQAEEVLEKMEHYKDANLGLTWDTISSYLGELKEG